MKFKLCSSNVPGRRRGVRTAEIDAIRTTNRADDDHRAQTDTSQQADVASIATAHTNRQNVRVQPMVLSATPATREITGQ